MEESQPNYETRNAEIISMRESGHTYDEIGTEHEISKERVRQILSETRPDLTGESSARFERRLQDQRPLAVVQQVRRKLGLTGQQLAKALRINQRTVGRYEFAMGELEPLVMARPKL